MFYICCRSRVLRSLESNNRICNWAFDALSVTKSPRSPTDIKKVLSPESNFFKKGFVDGGFRNEVQKVVDVFFVARLARFAGHRVPHQQAFVQLVDFWGFAECLVVGRELQVADLAGFLSIHQCAVLDFFGGRPTESVSVVRFDIAGEAFVNRIVEIAGSNVRWSLPRNRGTLSVVGQIEALD